MNCETPLDRRTNRAVKRAFDIVVSVPALMGIALLTPFLAYKIKKESKGPLIFRQQRTGKDGRTFWC